MTTIPCNVWKNPHHQCIDPEMLHVLLELEIHILACSKASWSCARCHYGIWYVPRMAREKKALEAFGIDPAIDLVKILTFYDFYDHL
jgi:hypothetical protein